MDERVVLATDTDDHVHRAYTLPNGQTVTLYLAYGVRMRDLMPHRPEVCYPSAGWTLDGKRQVDIPTQDGPHRPVQLFRFRQGGLETGHLAVLNYYVIDGEHCPDVSLLRSSAWRGRADIGYVAQVLIAARASPLQDQADDLCLRFAQTAAPAIERLLEEAVRAHSKSKLPAEARIPGD